MVQYWAERIILAALKINKPLGQLRICIRGITFRAGVKEFYHSRNIALAKLLMEKGLNTFVFDDLLSREEVESRGFRYIRPEEADLVFDCFHLQFEIKARPVLSR
jgi:UDP-N-acetyl-D-mannosaminuronic acid dehydrogenase